jgi:hypothetical protein
MTRPAPRLAAGLAATLLVGSVVALIAARPSHGAQSADADASRTAPWTTFRGESYSVSLPATPVPSTRGSADVEVAVAGGRAYTVARFPVPFGRLPLDVLAGGLKELTTMPALILTAHPSQVGGYKAVDFQARVNEGYFAGRMLVAGADGYLIGELGPLPGAPPDLTRLLTGFAPRPS